MLARLHLLIPLALLTSVSVGGRAQESKDYYPKWLAQDAAYIIAPEEADVFKHLATDEEKQQFIEQFWKRRDPNLATEENEFKTEHYRRIAYANDAFGAGIPGWKTDRGRTYIAFGPPDEIETHAGGSYSRRIEEGGGGTSVFPFERWYYRHLPGVGSNIELEFVDDTGGSLYRLAVDEHTKDALFYTPTSGLTLAESIGLVDKSARILNRFVTNPQTHGFGGTINTDPIKPYSSQNAPFERLYHFFDLQKPPRQGFRDLRPEVFTSISYQALPFDFNLGVTSIYSEGALVPVAIEIDTRELTFTVKNGSPRANVALYIRIESIDHKIFKELERDLDLDHRAQGSSTNLAAFQTNIPLRPGLYKITALVKDTASGKTGARVQSVKVPTRAPDQPRFSSILLTRSFQAARPDEGPLDPFRIGPLKAHINPTGRFSRDESIRFYVEIYDDHLAEGASGTRIGARLVNEAGVVAWQASNLNRELGRLGTLHYLAKELRLSGPAPGRYHLILALHDPAGRIVAEHSTDLTLR